MQRVAIGVGSNTNRRQHIRQGVRALQNQFGDVRCSPVYRTVAVGFDGPDFFNLACIFYTILTPSELKVALKSIECKEGRTQTEKQFASRTLDMDILLYGDEDLHSEGYDIPRKEITEEAYVLLPLSLLLVNEKHPFLNITFREMWEQFDGSEVVLPKRLDWMP